MIKNIPTYDQFENLGLQCICKSFEMLYSIGARIEEYSEEEIIAEEVTEDDYWMHNSITVSTSLIVLYQGIEYLMKSRITAKSALLLIEKNRTDWPTLPDKKDSDFDELQTISGENLLSVFCAILPSSFQIKNFVDDYKELRIRRNKLVHSTGVKDLEYKYVVVKILRFLSHFYTPTKWIEIFREMFMSDPTFGYWDKDVESAYFYRMLNFVEYSVSTAELKKYLPYNIKSRRYCCPECTYWLNKHLSNPLQPKWSFLNPNKPSSIKIECLICGNTYDVERKDCVDTECKGNVIYDEVLCLTCYKE